MSVRLAAWGVHPRLGWGLYQEGGFWGWHPVLPLEGDTEGASQVACGPGALRVLRTCRVPSGMLIRFACDRRVCMWKLVCLP